MREGRVARGRIEIAWEEHGRGARALVLVHGFTGSRRDFGPQLEALARLGRTVLVDLRGHGASSNTGASHDYRLDALCDDLLGVLDATGCGRCDLLGHSMGGMVALRAALRAPERLASLILMDTSPRALEGIPLDVFRQAWEIARQSGMNSLLEILRSRGSDSTRTDADRRLEQEWGDAYWSDWRVPNFTAMDPEAYAALGREMVEQASLEPRLGEIATPTLVLVGEQDAPFLASSEALERGIPDARLVLIPDAAHQPQLENPPAWLAALEDHLKRVRGA